eukprot:m.57055 g.57055  ORF g.57055 m.57055 type:complete len:133 (-) comp48994_c0_seq3:399-797(-)
MFWDPRTDASLCTLYMHKIGVNSVRWNMNGNHLLTASRDKLIKIFDIRTMRELQIFRGHTDEVDSIAWHPIHETLFSSGGSSGSLMFWMTGSVALSLLIPLSLHLVCVAFFFLGWFSNLLLYFSVVVGLLVY